jgi:hypothetical protein
VTSVKALSVLSTFLMRVSAASVKDSALRSPFLTVRAISEALIHSIAAASRL